MRDFVAWILVIWALLRLLCGADFPNVERFHYVVSTAVHSLTSLTDHAYLTDRSRALKDWQLDVASKILNFLLGRSSFIIGKRKYFKLIFLIWQAHSVTILDNTQVWINMIIYTILGV